MKKIIKDNHGIIQLLPTIALTIVILFSLLYIGTFINGTISSQLLDAYPSNELTTYNNTYWHNATGNGTIAYRNTTVTNQVSNLNGGISGIRVTNNGSRPIWFNLTTNGAYTFNQTITASNWVNTTVTALLASANLTATDTYVNFSWLTNQSTNRVRIRYRGSYLADANARTALENRTAGTIDNLTGDYDSVTEVVTIAAIIVVLTIPLMAVVALKRLF